MGSLYLVVIVLFVFLVVAALLKSKGASTADISYESERVLFTPAERSFLGVLEQVIGSEYRIFGKVRLADIIRPPKGLSKSRQTTALNKVNRKHVDFLICRQSDLSIVGAVELDDKSHRQSDREDRDGFVDKALSSAGIPIVHFPAKAGYQLAEVQAKLASLITPATVTHLPQPPIQQSLGTPELKPTAAVEPVANPAVEEQNTSCPACGAVMVKRKAANGPHAGKYFWACSSYPKCKKILPLEQVV